VSVDIIKNRNRHIEEEENVDETRSNVATSNKPMKDSVGCVVPYIARTKQLKPVQLGQHTSAM
jgi:hypothetical protein